MNGHAGMLRLSVWERVFKVFVPWSDLMSLVPCSLPTPIAFWRQREVGLAKLSTPPPGARACSVQLPCYRLAGCTYFNKEDTLIVATSQQFVFAIEKA